MVFRQDVMGCSHDRQLMISGIRMFKNEPRGYADRRSEAK